MDVIDRLKRYVDECVVGIVDGHGQIVGSGFFVAADLVLTCAHVVHAAGPGTAGSPLVLRHSGRTLPGKVLEAVPASPSTGRLVGYPDLALVQLDSDGPEISWVTLADPKAAGIGSELYIAGFSFVYSEPSAARHSRRAQPDEYELDDSFLRIKDCELPPGTSGGVLLDVINARIAGIVKTSRAVDSDKGGLAVPVHAVHEAFPALWTDCSTRPHPRWVRLCADVRSLRDPLQSVLRPEDHERLLRICAQRAFTQNDFVRIYQNIVGTHQTCHPGGLPELSYRPYDVRGFARELAEIDIDADPCLAPTVQLFDLLADELPPEHAGFLRACADYVAAGLDGEQRRYLTEYRSLQMNGAADRSGPVICVKLDVVKGSKDGYTVDIWSYSGRRSKPRRVHVAGQSGLTPRRLRVLLAQKLDEAAEQLPAGDVTIEFAMPRDLLKKPLEHWYAAEAANQLPVEYAIVVRCTDRTGKAAQNWRTRGQLLHSLAGAHCCSGSALAWLTCENPLPSTSLGAWLTTQPEIVALALGRTVSSFSKATLDAHIASGVPVILWHRDNCAEHAHVGGDPMTGIHCTGRFYQDWIKGRFHDVPLAGLPEFLQQARAAEVAEQREVAERHAAGYVLLWDDPLRVPWSRQLPLRDPALEP